MNLIVEIAWTHVRARVRQTGFAIAGVATASLFDHMASLSRARRKTSQSSGQHAANVTVSDERARRRRNRRKLWYAAGEIHGLTPEARRSRHQEPAGEHGGAGGVAAGRDRAIVKVQAIIRYANHDIATNVIGIDPRREAKVSDLPKQMRQRRSSRCIAPPTPSLSATACRTRSAPGSRQHHAADQPGRAHQRPGGRLLSFGRAPDRREHGLCAQQDRQILSQQTGLINELRVRLRDPMNSREIAERIERDTGYKWCRGRKLTRT